MIKNSEMKKGRFQKLARGRRIIARMNKCWNAGGLVRIGTALKYTDLKPKHRDLIEMDKSGSLYMRRGKRRDCIDFCSIQFSA